MSYKIFETTKHNYDPVNEYIDDQARLKRSASTWRNAKSIALVLIALGLFILLLAWAYYFFKKPHRLVSLSEINQKVLNNEERLIKNEKRLPVEEEVSLNSYNNQLQDKINEKDQEILELKNQLENNPKNETLKKEKEKLENDKKELEKKLTQQNNVQTDVIHFKSINSNINDQPIVIYTRLQYDDPRNQTPTTVTCYISFDNPEYPNIELGFVQSDFNITPYLRNQTGITYDQVQKIKSNYCQY